MNPRDDHEDPRREQAASIAGIEADVRSIDIRIKAEHEYIESVSEKARECCRTAQELEVQAGIIGGRVTRLEEDREKGSKRMATIETKQGATDRKLAWYAGALTVGAFLAPFLGDLVKQILLGR